MSTADPTAHTLPLWMGALYAAAAGSLGTLAGSIVPSAWLWPLVATLAIYPLFVIGVREGALGRTIGLVLLWALVASVTMLVVVRARGPAIGEQILRGPAYAAEMLHWIETGIGPEGSPELFIPIHLRHYGAFVVASGATAGFAGLYLGTVLLGYMNFYVAMLAANAEAPALAYAVGWPIWAVVRVVGFVAGGTALAHLALGRVLRRGVWSPKSFRRWMIASVALVLLDMLLKATLAETWRGLLVGALG